MLSFLGLHQLPIGVSGCLIDIADDSSAYFGFGGTNGFSLTGRARFGLIDIGLGPLGLFVFLLQGQDLSSDTGVVILLRVVDKSIAML